MSTITKRALASRIRTALERSDLSPDVRNVLAESAILFETTCEDADMIMGLVPMVIEHFTSTKAPPSPFGAPPFTSSGGVPACPGCNYKD